MDRVSEIAETTIWGQLTNSMLALYKRIGTIILRFCKKASSIELNESAS